MKRAFLLFFAILLRIHCCQAQAVQKEEVYTFVEEMPEFPGGQDSLHRYLLRHIRYGPAKDDEVAGTVRIRFVVDKTGTITDIKTTSGRQPNLLEKEVIRVMKSMPKWTPGRQKGKAVAVECLLPMYICYTQE